MVGDTTPPIQTLIGRFEWRARRRQLGAYGFLVLMMAGIGAAAYVFIQAEEITERETTTDITARMSSLSKLSKENDPKSEETIRDFDLAVLRELRIVTKESCKKLADVKLHSYHLGRIIFSFESTTLLSKPDVAKSLLSLGKVSEDADCVAIDELENPAQPLIFNLKQLEAIREQNWSASLISLEHEYNTFFHQREIYSSALSKFQELLRQKRHNAIDRRTTKAKHTFSFVSFTAKYHEI